ncbi:uncharacterized protein CDV56_105819 [Aspergillus thermomutatus]|uniref:Uncharacterized protein n=1 Tax=Aspergillus thermomutatus TaxID=41047 RepID=A0A397HCG4_ASPTH|nr:uncharacterized protein CDV56_105819 [Aspergillus thermomutatus]RHZ60801.1 hypothetical protein CDV56_105819 [Aspergillus thermomutatus]
MYTQSLPFRNQATGGCFDEQSNIATTQNPEPGIDPADLKHLGENLKILPVPSVDDDLETTAKKMGALAKVVSDGNSLALFTGLQLASQHLRDPESIAVSQMTPDERMQYEAWQRARKGRTRKNTGVQASEETSNRGQKIPHDFDWVQNVAPVPDGAQSLKKFTQRAAAMDIIWDHQGATPENASWLTFNQPAILPLVKAVCRVRTAEKHRQNNRDPSIRGLTDMEAAEVETVRKIVSLAERNRTRELEKIRKLTRSITESAAVIKARIKFLEDKMDG